MNHKVFIALMLTGLLLAACSGGAAATPTAEAIPTVLADSTIIAEGRLEPLRYVEMAFTTGGRVSEVLVKEGEAVKKGQELIRLGDPADTQYAAARLELVSAKKALTDLVNASETDLAQVVIDIKDAREEYDKAEDYLRYLKNTKKVPQTETFVYYIRRGQGYEVRTRTKFFKGPAPQDWIVEAENDLALKKARLEAAQKTYERMKDGVDAEQLAVLEARLAAAEAGLAAFSVAAPFDGVVAKMEARFGSSVNPGQPAVTVADFSEWRVKTTDLTEIDVVALKEGQPVTVTLDAIPAVELRGTILSIGQTYAENQGDIVYEVTIQLNEGDTAMRWGMTAAVTFEAQD